MEKLLVEMKTKCPIQYHWVFNNFAETSFSANANSPYSHGEFKPKKNWRMVWRDRVATLYVHGGKIGKETKCTFSF